MKQSIFIALFTICVLSCSIVTTVICLNSNSTTDTISAVELQTEKLNTSSSTDSAIAILLSPYIDKAIQDYFGKPTQYALYDAKVNDITQVGSDFIFTITITVPTFQGPHNPPYGLEKMSFIIKPGGSVTLKSYEHINVAN